MKRKIYAALLLCCLLLVPRISAAAPTIIPPQDYSYEAFPENLRTAEGMKTLPANRYDVTSLEQHIYDEENQLHFLYITAHKKAPLILYVQGSAWMKQDLNTHIFELYEFAKRGFNIAIVEYRDSSIAPFPAQVEDAKKALYYITQHSAEYNVDTNNLFLWGDSSGGHTVAMMNTTYNKEFQDFVLPSVRAVIDFYGPTNITTMNMEPSTWDHISADSAEGKFIGGKNVLANPKLAAETNIMNYISAERELAPMLICHGSKDRLVPFGQSIELYNKLKAAQQPVEFYKLAKADHSGEYFWHTATMDLVYAFMEKYMVSASAN